MITGWCTLGRLYTLLPLFPELYGLEGRGLTDPYPVLGAELCDEELWPEGPLLYEREGDEYDLPEEELLLELEKLWLLCELLLCVLGGIFLSSCYCTFPISVYIIPYLPLSDLNRLKLSTGIFTGSAGIRPGSVP